MSEERKPTSGNTYSEQEGNVFRHSDSFFLKRALVLGKRESGRKQE